MITKAVVLKQYFGMKPEQTLSEFMTELKALTQEEKDQLASAAARALKVPIENLAFTPVAY